MTHCIVTANEIKRHPFPLHFRQQKRCVTSPLQQRCPSRRSQPKLCQRKTTDALIKVFFTFFLTIVKKNMTEWTRRKKICSDTKVILVYLNVVLDIIVVQIDQRYDQMIDIYSFWWETNARLGIIHRKQVWPHQTKPRPKWRLTIKTFQMFSLKHTNHFTDHILINQKTQTIFKWVLKTKRLHVVLIFHYNVRAGRCYRAPPSRVYQTVHHSKHWCQTFNLHLHLYHQTSQHIFHNKWYSIISMTLTNVSNDLKWH